MKLALILSFVLSASSFAQEGAITAEQVKAALSPFLLNGTTLIFNKVTPVHPESKENHECSVSASVKGTRLSFKMEDSGRDSDGAFKGAAQVFDENIVEIKESKDKKKLTVRLASGQNLALHRGGNGPGDLIAVSVKLKKRADVECGDKGFFAARGVDPNAVQELKEPVKGKKITDTKANEKKSVKEDIKGAAAEANQGTGSGN